MEPITIELLSKFGPLGVFIFVAWRVADTLVNRIVKTLDKLGDRIDSASDRAGLHAEQMTKSLSGINERLAVIETRTERLDETPVQVPRGTYGIRAKDRP